ncbi:hypothetical protein ACWC9T_38190 [Kitasatospora sp. NPDC001159]
MRAPPVRRARRPCARPLPSPPEEVTAALARLHLLPVDVLLTSNEVPAECIRATSAALPATGPNGGTRWPHTAPADL